MADKAGRIDALVRKLDGAIKYGPMIDDLGTDHTHPWTGKVTKKAISDTEILARAREYHALAILRLKQALVRSRFVEMPAAQVVEEVKRAEAPELFADDGLPWNDRVPYCRNFPTVQMIAEARR